MWPSALSGRLPIVALVGRCPANQLIGRGPIACRICILSAPGHAALVRICGISGCFQPVSPCMRQVVHALLTRPPLGQISLGFNLPPFDLHVLGTPPAFILSQDRTLMLFHVVLSPCPVCARLLAPASFLVYPLVHLGSF